MKANPGPIRQAFGTVLHLPEMAIRGVGRAVFGPGRKPLRELGQGLRQAFGELPGSAMVAPSRARTMRRPAVGLARGMRMDGEAVTEPKPAKAMPEPTAPAARGSLSVSAKALEPFLGEGLKPYAQDFVDAGQQYGLDPRFLAAVSKLETADGTSSAFRNKHNAMGISNASGPIKMPSVRDSILRQASTLARESGPYAGARTIGEIGAIYAPPGAGNDPNQTNGYWPTGVARFYREMGGDPNKSIRGKFDLAPEDPYDRQGVGPNPFLVKPIYE